MTTPSPTSLSCCEPHQTVSTCPLASRLGSPCVKPTMPSMTSLFTAPLAGAAHWLSLSTSNLPFTQAKALEPGLIFHPSYYNQSTQTPTTLPKTCLSPRHCLPIPSPRLLCPHCHPQGLAFLVLCHPPHSKQCSPIRTSAAVCTDSHC